MESINDLVELMDEYLEFEKEKMEMRQKVINETGFWRGWERDEFERLEQVGLLGEYREVEEKQKKLLGVLPYYSDFGFGDDETKFVFEWLKSLIEEKKEKEE
jgi:hypothetical protein